MSLYAPDYYREFRCIGARCRHNCCIDWEIDVDADTYAVYQKIEGPFGRRLRAHIAEDGEDAHFRLDTEDRCPFLNRDNLCDIILELGEDALCQICTDHPRYRNFFESRTEIGLGLSCEAAAALILGRGKRPEMVCLEEGVGDVPEEEARFFCLRDEIMDMIFAEAPIKACMEQIAARFDIVLPDADWCAVYTGLEVLHEGWREKLKRLSENRQPLQNADMAAKQLLAYFVYRQTADCFFGERLHAGIAFCLHAVNIILQLSETPAALYEVARQYSEEIEYSEENMETIFKLFGRRVICQKKNG